ncbi:transcriptional regulator PpsR [Humitalea sp. 24SJ18S-53]|uniref:transcriptional regulator PpsR n=1 Tax=Humitalea sp. 24SJ18S-53 TaxID=3422307 RepID=UPI003D670143
MNRVNFAQPDITLTLDWEGVIRTAAHSSAIPTEQVADWVGRPWIDTVGDSGGDWIRRMLDDARNRGVSAFRQVRQRFPSGLELPIEYTTVRLGGEAGLMAIGKNLQAVAELQSRLIATQQAREQDYWKLREIETRSRLLFDASNEAVLVVEAESLRVIEANPAAIRAIGLAPGWEFLREVAPRDEEAFRGMLRRAREQGRAPGILVHLGAERASWLVRATLMTRDPGPVFLLQLASAATDAHSAARGTLLRVEEMVERLPDAFVVTDQDGTVRRANKAFLELVQVATEAGVLGQSAGRWLARPGSGLGVLLASLHDHGEVRLFPTVITGEVGLEAEVEISAASSGIGGTRAIGMVIRDVGRRIRDRYGSSPLRDAMGAIEKDIGTTPLPALVRRVAAALERHCIERALALADGNRTATAELLGLSRQSLYAKLGRYGFHAGLDEDAEEAG